MLILTYGRTETFCNCRPQLAAKAAALHSVMTLVVCSSLVRKEFELPVICDVSVQEANMCPRVFAIDVTGLARARQTYQIGCRRSMKMGMIVA